MVDGVRAAAQSEIDDIDAVYLSDVLVSFSPVDVFGDQFGNAEQHALEIGVLVVVLNLEENQGTFGVLGKDVDAVALVELAFLVALAFEQPPDGDFLVEQGGQQPFQYGKVRFIPKEAFHRPVETNIITYHTIVPFLLICFHFNKDKVKMLNDKRQAHFYLDRPTNAIRQIQTFPILPLPLSR